MLDRDQLHHGIHAVESCYDSLISAVLCFTLPPASARYYRDYIVQRMQAGESYEAAHAAYMQRIQDAAVQCVKLLQQAICNL
jgi:hypothetical protein